MYLFKNKLEVSYIELHQRETDNSLRLCQDKKADLAIDVSLFTAWDFFLLLYKKLKNSLYDGLKVFKRMPHNTSLDCYYGLVVILATAFKVLATYFFYRFKIYRNYDGNEEKYANKIKKIKTYCFNLLIKCAIDYSCFLAASAAAKAFAGALLILGGPHGLGMLVIATAFFAITLAIKDTYAEYSGEKEKYNNASLALCAFFACQLISYTSSYLAYFIPAIPHLPASRIKMVTTTIRTCLNITSFFIYKYFAEKYVFPLFFKQKPTTIEAPCVVRPKLRRTKNSPSIIANLPAKAHISNEFKKEIIAAYEKRWGKSNKEGQKIKKEKELNSSQEENKENQIPKRQASPPIAIPKSKQNKTSLFPCRSAPSKSGFFSGADKENSFKGFRYGTAC